VKDILNRVNEAVRERENLRRAKDMQRMLDKRLLETTTDPELVEYKVSNCSPNVQHFYIICCVIRKVLLLHFCVASITCALLSRCYHMYILSSFTTEE